MENILFALNAVLPIVLLIALGYGLKKIKLVSTEFLAVGNKLCFKVFLPCLLFFNIYKVENLSAIDWPSALYCVCGIFIAFFIGFVVMAIFVKDRKRKGAVWQCVFRSNYAIIGIPLVEMLGRDTTLAALLSVFSIPVFNILAVIVLSIYSGDETENKSVQFKKTLKGIAKNPLIHGVLLGIIVVAIRELFVMWGINFRLKDIKFLYTSVEYISKITTPFALIVLGGQFEFVSFKNYSKEIILATITRTVIVPLVTISIACFVFGFRGDSVASFIALYASPVAVASAIMAREMGSDGDLAGALVVSTTVFSSVTLVLLIYALKLLAFL